MTRVLLRPEARTDALDAFGYYEQRRPGLGVEFREALDSAFARIVETPFAHPIVHRDVHRALVTRFPYAVFYRVAPDSNDHHCDPARAHASATRSTQTLTPEA